LAKSKPQLAIALVEELLALGFRFSVVLADSLYGANSGFIRAWHRHHLEDVVAIRSNHGVWMLPGQRIRRTCWRSFERVFTDGTSQQRCICETIFGTRQAVCSFQITTDPATLPPETTWDRMTKQGGTIEQTVGNTFELRTWIAYGPQHAKDDLDWADDRVTEYATIERWWEVVMSADTLVSLQRSDSAALGHLAPTPAPAPSSSAPQAPAPDAPSPLEAHPAWDTRSGWKHHRTTLRLLLQPDDCSCLLLPWLHVVPLPHVQAVRTGLAALGSLVNTFRLVLPT
jgi:hypothetical protein